MRGILLASLSSSSLDKGDVKDNVLENYSKQREILRLFK